MATRKAPKSGRAAPRQRPARPARGKTAKRAKTAPRTARSAPKPAARRNPKPKPRRQPETLRLRAVAPSLTVRDLARSVDFYTRALGCVVTERWESEGALLGVMLRAGRCGFGLSQDDGAKGRDRKLGQGVRFWCETAQDRDALAARVRAAGGAADGPASEPWGELTVSVDDPDGYHFSFTRAKA